MVEEEKEGDVEAREHPEPSSGTEEYKLLIGAHSHSLEYMLAVIVERGGGPHHLHLHTSLKSPTSTSSPPI